MPPDLKERVQEAADKAGRSLHAELIHTLEEKYPRPRTDFDLAMQKLVLGLVTRKDDDIKAAINALKDVAPVPEGGKIPDDALADFQEAIVDRVMALETLSDDLGRRKFSLKELSDAGLIDPKDAS